MEEQTAVLPGWDSRSGCRPKGACCQGCTGVLVSPRGSNMPLMPTPICALQKRRRREQGSVQTHRRPQGRRDQQGLGHWPAHQSCQLQWWVPIRTTMTDSCCGRSHYCRVELPPWIRSFAPARCGWKLLRVFVFLVSGGRRGACACFAQDACACTAISVLSVDSLNCDLIRGFTACVLYRAGPDWTLCL